MDIASGGSEGDPRYPRPAKKNAPCASSSPPAPSPSAILLPLTHPGRAHRPCGPLTPGHHRLSGRSVQRRPPLSSLGRSVRPYAELWAPAGAGTAWCRQAGRPGSPGCLRRGSRPVLTACRPLMTAAALREGGVGAGGQGAMPVPPPGPPGGAARAGRAMPVQAAARSPAGGPACAPALRHHLTPARPPPPRPRSDRRLTTCCSSSSPTRRRSWAEAASPAPT